jgi:hypothetical protein
MSDVLGKDSRFYSMMADQVTPLVLMLFNQQLIPFCVAKVGEFTDFELKSDKHISTMRQYFFFLLLNTVVMPITGITTMEQVLKKTVDSYGGTVQANISRNLVNSSTFFLKYIISCTFLSSCLLIFDVGHQVYNLIIKGGLCSKKRTEEQLREKKVQHSLSAYKDVWYFDMGSHIAFTVTVYLVVLMFSQVSPIITPFGVAFFGIKYFIDKYNIIYVYPSEYVGEGRLYKRVVSLQYFCIFFSQLVMFGIFNIIFSSKYLPTCIFILVLQAVLLGLYRLFPYLPIAAIKRYLSKGFMDE